MNIDRNTSLNLKFKKWHLVAAILLAISAVSSSLYGVDITAETSTQNKFAVRLVLVLGGLISAALITTFLHLYFRKRKLLKKRDRLIAEIRDDSARIKVVCLLLLQKGLQLRRLLGKK